MKKRVFLFFVTLLSFSVYSQSIEFKEIDCKISSAEKDYIQKVFDFELEYYRTVFNLENVSLKITAFGDYREFKNFEKQIAPNMDSEIGFYSHRLRTCFIHKGKRFLNIVNHEMSHLILRSVINVVPKWINEGLAEWFESFYIIDNSVVQGFQNSSVIKVKEWINRGEIDLEEFFRYSNDMWVSQDKAPIRYSRKLSYCLVYFLFKQDSSILKKLKPNNNLSCFLVFNR